MLSTKKLYAFPETFPFSILFGRPHGAAPTTLLRLTLYVWHSRFCVGDGVLDVPLYAPSKLPANGMSGGHPLRITRTSFVERNKSFRLNVPVGVAYMRPVRHLQNRTAQRATARAAPTNRIEMHPRSGYLHSAFCIMHYAFKKPHPEAGCGSDLSSGQIWRGGSGRRCAC